MILDADDKYLYVVMGADPTSTQPTFHVSYVDLSVYTDPAGFNPISDSGVLTGDAGKIIVDAPDTDVQRQIKFVNVHNKDSVQQTFTFYELNGGNVFELYKVALPAGKSVWWTPDVGWTPGGVPGPQGDTGAQGDTGDPGITWQGAWSSLVTYAENDGVLANGSSYRALGTTLNDPPSSSPSDWVIVAEKGTDGADGDDGAPGANGKDAGFNFLFNDSTTPANPGTGKVMFNSGVTQIFVNETDNDGNGLSGWLDIWDDSTGTIKGYAYVMDASDPAKYKLVSIGTQTDSGSYRTINCAVVSSNGTIANNAPVKVQFTRTGNDGADGADGADAVNGLPVGGTTGQVLTKNSGTDYDADWEDAAGGGSGAITHAASVYLTSDLSMNDATYYDIAGMTEEYDDGTCHNATTGEYTPGQDCQLHVDGMWWFASLATGAWVAVEIWKNGSKHKLITQEPATPDSAFGTCNTNFSITVKSNATDVWKIRIAQYSGGGAKTLKAGYDRTWLVWTCHPR